MIATNISERLEFVTKRKAELAEVIPGKQKY